MEVVYRWAKGEQFSEIMKYTDVDEGTIVRLRFFWNVCGILSRDFSQGNEVHDIILTEFYMYCIPELRQNIG